MTAAEEASTIHEQESGADNSAGDAAAGVRFAYSGTELDAMSGAESYYRWIIRHFAPFTGREILEVGAGVGTFASHLLAALPRAETVVQRLTLIEPASNLFPALQRRFRDNHQVTTLQGDLESCADSLRPDTTILVNVLEHVKDDEGCLALLHRILQPGGHLLIFVPALPWLYGSLDAAFEHYRRYTRAELERKLRAAGFELRKSRFVNLPGVAAWWLSGKILRRKTLAPGAVRFYDRWVIRPWSRCEDVWAPPLGQNLLAIARKTQQ
jgi:SAM-dependent methyltransferase